jgi:HD-GYP domain-containing protein (c-di-GMP phosphodiesterase class II)
LKLKKLAEVKEGDLLARAVFSSDYQILLADDTILTVDYIEKLNALGITAVYVHAEGYRNEESVSAMMDEIEELFHENVKNILERHIYARNWELRKLSQTAEEIISNILEERDVINRIYDIRERSSDIYEHSIATCTLATLVSLKLRLDKKTIHDISVACLLHDIGLRYLNFEYDGRYLSDFNAVEANDYYKHPIYGYTSLKDESWISEIGKLIILYHHENLDGSGFPMKMKDAPLEAQIVSICNTFDEMISGICREQSKVHTAIEHLRVNRGKKYNDIIVNVLLEYLAVYPVGTNVITSDNEVGVVIRQNRGFSDRPVIKIFKDKDGLQLSELRIIDLKKEPTILIDKVLDQA